MRTLRHLLLYTIILFNLDFLTAQSLLRRVALLDLTLVNEETGLDRLFSAQQMLNVAGIPYDVVEDPMVAINYAVILSSSQLLSNSLSDTEKISIGAFVKSGGILVASRVLDEDLFDLFGISNFVASNENYEINWSMATSSNLFRWFDEEAEWSISLGRPSIGEIFKTYSYELTNAVSLGHYGDGSVAAIRNDFGAGFAYSLGVSWRDVILRNQINRDFEAQRVSSNGFEPTQDALMLLIRSIVTEHVPFMAWKHTSTQNSTSTLMITHDIDSKTGIDTMQLFSASEAGMDISATYNITVRYFSDAIIGDFYTGTHTQISNVLADGHVIASHSVGHFPDFGDSEIFPVGHSNNSMVNYQPRYDGLKTTGGSVFGECQVSKDVLERDLKVPIEIFRAGHLVYNDFLVDVLDTLGYRYNSSYSAADVLTHFPYQNVKGRSFIGSSSNIYELPVTISDIFHNQPITADNYLEKVDVWTEVIRQNDANNAPTVLLIHPNRFYKLKAQEYLLSLLPASMQISEMGAFGDFWRAREFFEFDSKLIDSILYLTIAREHLLPDNQISLVIHNGQDLKGIVTQDEELLPIAFTIEDWEGRDVILYRPVLVSDSKNDPRLENVLRLYPNPAQDLLNLDLNLGRSSTVKVEILNLLGRRIVKSTNFVLPGSGQQKITLDISSRDLTDGVYFCKIEIGGIDYWRKVMIN